MELIPSLGPILRKQKKQNWLNFSRLKQRLAFEKTRKQVMSIVEKKTKEIEGFVEKAEDT